MPPMPTIAEGIAELEAREHAHGQKIAAYIEAHPEQAITDAKAYVTQFLASPAHQRYSFYLNRWAEILNTLSPVQIATIFRDAKPKTQSLRSSSPFCGDEIQALLTQPDDDL
jgi:negative regulator of replication initiation